jgi:hypothetical protein
LKKLSASVAVKSLWLRRFDSDPLGRFELAPAGVGSVLVWRFEVAPLSGRSLLVVAEKFLAVAPAEEESEAFQVLAELFGSVSGVADVVQQ